MTNQTPPHRVSIITAMYNAESFIGDTARSVFDQMEVSIEWIVIDDASTDHSSKTLLDEYSKHCPQHVELIHVRLDENIGSRPGQEYGHGLDVLVSNGVRQSTAPYFKVLDADDVLVGPNVLERQANMLASHPEAGLVFGEAQIVDRNLQPMRQKGLPHNFRDGGNVRNAVLAGYYLFAPRTPFIHGTMMYSREVLSEMYRDEQLRYEVGCVVDLIRRDGTLLYDEEVSLLYRVHGRNFTLSHDEIGNSTDEASIRDRLRLVEGMPGERLAASVITAYWNAIYRSRNRLHEAQNARNGEARRQRNGLEGRRFPLS